MPVLRLVLTNPRVDLHEFADETRQPRLSLRLGFRVITEGREQLRHQRRRCLLWVDPPLIERVTGRWIKSQVRPYARSGRLAEDARHPVVPAVRFGHQQQIRRHVQSDRNRKQVVDVDAARGVLNLADRRGGHRPPVRCQLLG